MPGKLLVAIPLQTFLMCSCCNSLQSGTVRRSTSNLLRLPSSNRRLQSVSNNACCFSKHPRCRPKKTLPSSFGSTMFSSDPAVPRTLPYCCAPLNGFSCCSDYGIFMALFALSATPTILACCASWFIGILRIVNWCSSCSADTSLCINLSMS